MQQGTSAAAPAFAAVVSLLNQARLAQGGKQMGFLNPFLYANADAFTSINLGSDKFTRNDDKKEDDDDQPPSVPLPYGFNCTQGWDPVTGLGTPLFEKLLAAALTASS